MSVRCWASPRAARSTGAAMRAFRGFALCSFALLAGCGDKTEPVLAALTIDADPASIEVGDSYQFSARNARGAVTWTSSNTGVATVVSTGFVTATGAGTSRITARTATDSASALITVRALRVIALSTANVSVGAPAITGGTIVQDVNVTNGGPGTITGLNVTEIRFPEGTGTPWLTAQLTATTATAAAGAVLRLSAAVTDLAPGVYSATVILAADANNIVPASVNVTFAVADTPTIDLSQTSAAFTATSGGASPAAARITVRSGTAARTTGLTATITYNEPSQTGWLTATLDSGSTVTGLTLQATPGVRPAGTYTASVRVASSNAAIAARTVLVSFAIAGQPRIDVSSASTTFNATVAGSNPAPQVVAITNGGGGALSGLATSITYGSGSGWLSATLSSTGAPSDLTLRATTGALAAGTYTATVRVSATNASNTPRDITVQFIVASQPTIVLSSAAASFSAAVGGANPAASTISVTSGNAATLSGLSATVLYTTGSGWLSATLSTTTAPATLTLQPTTGTLAAGTYTARVSVASAVADNSPRIVDVTFAVSAGPVIAVSPASLTFTSSTTTSPPAQTVAITNTGGGSLTGLAAVVEYAGGSSGWLTATLNTTTAPATLTVQATRGSLAAGTYTANVRLTSTVGGVAAVLVPVTYTITLAPSIALSATTRSYAAVVGNADPAAQTVTITNGGGGTLSSLSTSTAYGAGGSGWLTASLSSTTATSTLTLTVARGALLTGTYTATVSVASPVASNSPQTITVSLSVTAPAITLSATTRSATIGQGNGTVTAPTIPTITITNSGDGTLTGLTATVTYLTGPELSGWLTGATLNTTTAPATLTISMNAGSPSALRPVGTYTAQIRITSSVASNSPQDITVQMIVGLSLANSGVYAALVSTSTGGGSCALSGCHAAGSSEPNLSTAALFRSNMVSIATNRGRTGVTPTYPLANTYPVRIVAGNATNSYLKYQLDGTSGALRMPTSPTALMSATNRTLVTNWINDGALP